MTTCTYPHCNGGKYGVFCFEQCHRMCLGGARDECRRCWRRTESKHYPLIQPWDGHGNCPDRIPQENQ